MRPNRPLLIATAMVCLAASFGLAQISTRPAVGNKPAAGSVWISHTVTGGITGGSRRIVVNTTGEVLELQMSPGREKSNPIGKLDEPGSNALTEMIAELPRFIAPEKDKEKVVDGQTFEIRVKDDQKALWYTATPDSPERVKKLSTWLSELPERMKKDK